MWFGIDTANGATYKIAERIFSELGIEYKIIENEPSGVNINRECGSTHMERISGFVKKNSLSLGISYDGDGDRCLLTDENGEVVDGDIILAIIAKFFRENGRLNNDTIVSTVMSNLGLNKFAKENGFELKQTKVGDRYVLEEMLKNRYNLRRGAVWAYYFARL